MGEARLDWYRQQAEHHGGVARYNARIAFGGPIRLRVREAYIYARLAAHFARLVAGQSPIVGRTYVRAPIVIEDE